MPERRSEPEIDWDFSFVGDPADDRQDEPTRSDAADVDWDFSFVDADRDAEDRRRRVRGQPTSPRPTVDDDVDWDFSFVGEPTLDRSASTPNPGRVDERVEWDFSFVDAEREPSPSSNGAVARSAVRSAPEAVGQHDLADEPVHADGLAHADEHERADHLGVDDDRNSIAEQEHDLAVDDSLISEDDLPDATPIVSRVDDLPMVETADRASAVAPEELSETEQLALDALAPTDELDRPSLLDDLEHERDGGVLAASAAPATATAESTTGSDDAESPTSATAADATPVGATVAPIDPVKVLTICTHNRTRSVMMMALLQAGFDRAVGEGRVMVRSLGFGPEGEEPIADAVDEMAERGIDVSAHRSLQVTGPRVEPADLILTAERDHVAKVAEASPDAFRRTFTLPEFCRSIAHDPVPGNRSLREWLHSMSSARTPAEYLSADVPEVDDPTGSPKRQFASATVTIESMCDTVVDLLEVSVGRPNWRGDTADQG